MSDVTLQAALLTLKLASMTTLLLLLFATPLAWWLSRWRGFAKPIVQAIIALPLVLPPTVLGFYLLIAFAPQSPVGEGWLWLTGQPLAFSFYGILFGSMVYSLPFAVQPIMQSFQAVNPLYMDVAQTMGVTGWQRFRRLVLPMTKSGFITAAGLVFAHTIGEFGVVLMIGGNIAGETKVLSMALFDQVESLNFAEAHRISLLLILFSAALLALLFWLNRSQRDS